MNLLHYSDVPVELDRDRVYPQSREHWRAHKPNGLWVSVEGEDDWPTWCRSEGFCVGSLDHAHRVVLRADAPVLHLSTPEELDAFHLGWSYESEMERRMVRSDLFSGSDAAHYSVFVRRQWPIDWAKVAAQWDGIIIAPYLWSRRLDGPFWYYGFDCASGCIWNLDAIESFTKEQPC